MIGKIKGTLIEVHNNIGLIETNSGVSYQVYLPPSLISQTSPISLIEVLTYLQVRDDALVLFGFENKKQLELFTLLLTVPSVGPKTAFTVISFSQIDSLIQAVQDNDVAYFSTIPGLGRKTAMKIILELSQKLKDEFNMEKMYLSADDKTVLDALVSLGYKSQEARKLLSKVPKNLTVEERIKHALKVKLQ